jgi:hypothetical protein
MGKSSVTVKKVAFQNLADLVKRMKGRRVEVGLFDGEMALIGLWMEFGTKTIPERPWLRSTFITRRDDIIKFQARIVRLLLQGKLEEERAMALLGEYVVSLLREQIIKFGPTIFTPLAPATIRAKGGKTTPLINTGALVGAITYRVLKGDFS